MVDSPGHLARHLRSGSHDSQSPVPHGGKTTNKSPSSSSRSFVQEFRPRADRRQELAGQDGRPRSRSSARFLSRSRKSRFSLENGRSAREGDTMARRLSIGDTSSCRPRARRRARLPILAEQRRRSSCRTLTPRARAEGPCAMRFGIEGEKPSTRLEEVGQEFLAHGASAFRQTRGEGANGKLAHPVHAKRLRSLNRELNARPGPKPGRAAQGEDGHGTYWRRRAPGSSCLIALLNLSAPGKAGRQWARALGEGLKNFKKGAVPGRRQTSNPPQARRRAHPMRCSRRARVDPPASPMPSPGRPSQPTPTRAKTSCRGTG